MNKEVKSLLCRTGRKKYIASVLIRYAPKNFNKYVESFVGTGDIYFKLRLGENVKAYLNDIDADVIEAHKLIKKNPQGDPNAFKGWTLEQVKRLDKTPKSNLTDYNKLAKIIYRTCSTYGATGLGKIYKIADISSKLKRIPAIAHYMKNTTITKGDWKKTFIHDSKDTFFYLDPPYEHSKDLYKQDKMDYEELANKMRKLKGKVMLSINASPQIKKLFKGFKIRSIVQEAKHGATAIGGDDRKEFLITNY